ncbi:hypothetical protein [Rhodococcoides kyotonense]|uniref:Acyltransferase n=1 Tax=Rhodococcoides kyotonense TaxID=398843 RepID=A0A177YH04_9NOCA|nr:hypothetical protein [Rhodococcus kyotonensis]OAK54836.1 hypothetical protein A3K89_05855 [Rhodococcus kyotonensis]
MFFFGGAALWALSTRLPLTWVLAAISAVLIVVFAWAGVTTVVSAIPLAYLCIWLGQSLPFRSIGAKNDISYGVYLYAFPLQQLLVFGGLASLNPWAFSIIAAVLAVGAGYSSCKLIEQPALRLKSWSPSRRMKGASGRSPVGPGIRA